MSGRALALLFLALPGCASVPDPEARFDGLITPQSVEAFLGGVQGRRVPALAIRSPGGELISAMRFGEWVRDQRLALRVEGRCGSACANYVFTAAERKTIAPGAVVYWHGSAEQKDFRERDERLVALRNRLAAGDALDADERGYLDQYGRILDYSTRARRLQREFFASLGVAEYVTRAGQEPERLGHSWTLSAEDMKRFGICNVVAPEGYGSANYLAAHPLPDRLVVPLELNEGVLAALAAQPARPCP